MKTSDLSFRWISCIKLAAALVCIPCPLTLAEPLTPPAATTDIKATKYDLEIEGGQLIRPGGRVEATLPNVVNALRDEYTNANIVLAQGLAKLKVSDLKLRAGSPAEELEAVRVACDDKFEIQAFGGPANRVEPTTGLPLDLTTGFPIPGGKRQNPDLFVLREPKPTPETKRVVEAFNIGPYLDWLRRQPGDSGHGNVDPTDNGVTQIGNIITDTISRLKNGSPDADYPTWQYHKGATLMVVIGTRDSVEIAGKIVNALPGMSSVGEQSRAQFGLQSARGAPSAADRAAADDAFRAQYGFVPRQATTPQPGNAAPEASPPK